MNLKSLLHEASLLLKEASIIRGKGKKLTQDSSQEISRNLIGSGPSSDRKSQAALEKYLGNIVDVLPANSDKKGSREGATFHLSDPLSTNQKILDALKKEGFKPVGYYSKSGLVSYYVQYLRNDDTLIQYDFVMPGGNKIVGHFSIETFDDLPDLDDSLAEYLR